MLTVIRRTQLVSKARNAARAQDWSTAASLYRRATALTPSRAQDWLQLGHALKHGGDMRGAQEAYRRAIAIAPRWSEPRKQLGLLLWDQGDDAEAVESFGQAVGLGDTDPMLRQRMAEAGLNAGAVETAILYGLRAIPVPSTRRHAGVAGLIRSTARKAARRGDWTTAVARYEALLQRAPDDGAAWVQLGHACKQRGESGAAEAAYRRAVALEPSSGDVLRHLGFTLRENGKRDAARAVLQAAQQLLPAAADIDAALDDLGPAPNDQGGHAPGAPANAFAVRVHTAEDDTGPPPKLIMPSYLSPAGRADYDAVVRAVLAARTDAAARVS